MVHGALNDLAIQDSMRVLFQESYGTIQNPLPMAQRRELGGVILYYPATNTYKFERRLNQLDSHCAYMTSIGKIFTGQVLVGVMHTHPIRDGESYDCPVTGETGLEGNAEGTGGGSGPDWTVATNEGVPMYTMDPDRMWRLEPNTPEGSARTGNTERWLSGTTNQCSDRADL